MKKLLFLAFLLCALPAVLAACPVTLSASNTQALLTEIPTLNADLQACPMNIPGPMNRLVGSGNVNFVINMNDGTTQTIFISTANNQATQVLLGANKGTAGWTATISEANLDVVLASRPRAPALTQAYIQGKLTIRANTFFKRVGWFFTQPFVKRAANKAVASNPPQQRAPPMTGQPYTPGKPAHCDETYMEGHEGYQYAKANWDQYKADTDGVCQMQQGYLNDNHCIYGVQGGKGGVVYYLCWYRNS